MSARADRTDTPGRNPSRPRGESHKRRSSHRSRVRDPCPGRARAFTCPSAPSSRPTGPRSFSVRAGIGATGVRMWRRGKGHAPPGWFSAASAHRYHVLLRSHTAAVRRRLHRPGGDLGRLADRPPERRHPGDGGCSGRHGHGHLQRRAPVRPDGVRHELLAARGSLPERRGHEPAPRLRHHR